MDKVINFVLLGTVGTLLTLNYIQTRRLDDAHVRLLVAQTDRIYAYCRLLHALRTTNSALDYAAGRITLTAFKEQSTAAAFDRDRHCPLERPS